MSNGRYVLLAAAIAVAITTWRRGLNRTRRRKELDSAREKGNPTGKDRAGKRTQEDEIEDLDAEERELILRELGGQA